jgi:hypothetical protein
MTNLAGIDQQARFLTNIACCRRHKGHNGNGISTGGVRLSRLAAQQRNTKIEKGKQVRTRTAPFDLGDTAMWRPDLLDFVPS